VVSDKIKITYEGDNALKISYLKQEIKDTIKYKLKGLSKQLSTHFGELDSAQLKTMQK
jgi:hypothetical protein